MPYKISELAILPIESVAGTTKTYFERARQLFGFVPNAYGAMANEPALYESYATTYAACRAECGFTPVEQEVIFLTISREHGCEYCVAAHSYVADAISGVPTEITDAIRAGEPLGDTKLAALATFTQRMVASRGRPTDADVAAFKAAGYGERNILGIILAISIKTISNYTNQVFQTPLDEKFVPRIWKSA